MIDHIGLEVCVDSPAGLLSAVRAGADRIELCSALALSGLTPVPGLMALAARQAKPSYAMIRAHPGPFRYSRQDLDVMRGDIDAAREAGLPGVVIGANRADGTLDEDLLRALADHATGLAMTLHRAFDLVPDFEAALETAIDLGFERILTSGGARTAILGAERIAQFVVQAEGRISIMAGCGVGPGNVADLVRRTGVREVHGSFGAPVAFAGEDPVAQARSVELGFVQADLRDTDPALVAQVVEILAQRV
jgi:copper homeostasis protein